MVALVNLGAEPFEVTRGMRIAQMVVARVERVAFRPVDALPPTDARHGRVRQHADVSGVRSLQCGRRSILTFSTHAA